MNTRDKSRDDTLIQADRYAEAAATLDEISPSYNLAHQLRKAFAAGVWAYERRLQEND
jgi:hypothetical protein